MEALEDKLMFPKALGGFIQHCYGFIFASGSSMWKDHIRVYFGIWLLIWQGPSRTVLLVIPRVTQDYEA